jgi:hypothetical protein
MYDVLTNKNFSPTGPRYYLPQFAHTGSARLSFLEMGDWGSTILEGNTGLYDTVYVPPVAWSPMSGMIGDGTAAVFTYDLAANFPMATPGINLPSVFALYLITATFQSTSGDANGAYLMAVTRMSSGHYTGTLIAFGSVNGFTAPPTISTAGVLSLNMALYYRARVSRLDNNTLNPATFA